MAIDCVVTDDLCNLQQSYIAWVAEADEEVKVNTKSFDLGVFGGREYTYTWINGYPTILIESVVTSKIGKFEVEDAYPPNYLMTDE